MTQIASMIEADKRRQRALLLRTQHVTLGQWINLHDDVEQAITTLFEAASRKDWWRWPLFLDTQARAAAVAAHTVTAYQSGGWAVGVVSNALGVLPFVPDALDRTGFPVQAEDVRRTLKLFSKDLDFEEVDSQAQSDAVNVIEKWQGYNDFLAEIEHRLPGDWEVLGTPKKILEYAADSKDAPIWINSA